MCSTELLFIDKGVPKNSGMTFDPDFIISTHSAIMSGGIDYCLSFRAWGDYQKLQSGLETIGASSKAKAVADFIAFTKPAYEAGGLVSAAAFCETNMEKVGEYFDCYLGADEDVTQLIEDYVERQIAE